MTPSPTTRERRLVRVLGILVAGLTVYAVWATWALTAPVSFPPQAPETEPAARRTARPVVRIEREARRFVYRIDGEEQRIRGMGYNVLYVQRGLPPEERERRLREDFAFLRSIGVNTLQSWEEPEVDALHLDLAAEYGLDVVLYYHLPRTDDYADPAVQALHLERLREWMETWRDHPAVVMWGIGNETLLHSSCESAQPFLHLYVQLVREARAIDPDRPVVYREAEDVMVPCFRDAFNAAGGVPDQFIYGMNFYTLRMADVLATWADKGFNVPLFISEFAPIGLSPADRPVGFRQFWEVIQRHGDRVIGGAPYTWTTEGPEATDRLFGLVNDDNYPLDASLLLLSEMWGGSYGRPGASSVTVPNVRGRSLGEARALLYAAGLNVQVLEPRGVRRGGPSAVRNQSPRPGTTLARGSIVQVVAPFAGEAGDDGLQFAQLVVEARVILIQRTGEPPDAFDQRRAAARAAIERELAGLASGTQAADRVAQLAEWRSWLETLAHTRTPGQEVFPGAQNVVPVYVGLSRFAVQDRAAFEQALTFARAVVAEWIASTAISG